MNCLKDRNKDIYNAKKIEIPLLIESKYKHFGNKMKNFKNKSQSTWSRINTLNGHNKSKKLIGIEGIPIL